jgi:hypothetical protein
MEKAYRFVQITLLGLIVGVLLVLSFQINYWASDIKTAIRNAVIQQNHDQFKQSKQFLFKKKRPRICKPKTPKQKI